MERKTLGAAVWWAFVCVSVLAVSSNVSADTQLLEPGIPFVFTEVADAMAYITCNWSVTSSADIHFTVSAPDGSTLVDSTGSSYDSILLAPDSGEYAFKWTNTELSSVNLTFTVVSQSTGIHVSERIYDAVFLGILVGAIVIVMVIALVIVIGMKGGRKPQPHAVGATTRKGATGEAPSPYVPGMCPRCGSPIDSIHAYCPKCGHRVR